MEYTYFGDLLGMSSFYKLSPKVARDKLSRFYEQVYQHLSDYVRESNEEFIKVKVFMWSDSLFIWGDDVKDILTHLQQVYLGLCSEGLLLRGALVSGKLKFEPRLEVQGMVKDFPNDDTLARAVALERMYKGARLTIDNVLVENLLSNSNLWDWMTSDGYIRNIRKDICYENVLRLLCQTPDNVTYELLYFWDNSRKSDLYEEEYKDLKEKFEEAKAMSEENIKIHYEETMKLLDRCHRREKLTRERGHVKEYGV